MTEHLNFFIKTDSKPVYQLWSTSLQFKIKFTTKAAIVLQVSQISSFLP